MKVLFLYDVPEPPDPNQRVSGASFERDNRSAEASVFRSLRRLGHEVEPLAIYDNVFEIIETVRTFQPEVVFNCAESFYHDRAQEPNVCALLELMKVRYTGAGPDALWLCKDKALAKKVLAYHRIHVPRFVVSHRKRPVRSLKRFHYPAFVKPSGEDSSDGISLASLVRTEPEAMERVKYLHQKFHCDVLIEEYIEGRELYLSVLGTQRLTVLAPREIFFEGMPEGGPRFATAHAKWNMEYRERWNIMNGPAEPMTDEIRKKLDALAKKVYRVLKLRGFGRLDVRLNAAGEVYVIEANPNPSLDEIEDFSQAALESGIEYDALVQSILDAA